MIRNQQSGEAQDTAVVFFQNEQSVDFALNMNGRVGAWHAFYCQILDDKSLRVVPISQDLKHFLYKLQLPYFKDPSPSKASPKEERGATTSIRLHNVPADMSEENFRKELSQIKFEYTLRFYTTANKPDRKSAVLTFKTSSDCESTFNQLKGGVGSALFVRCRL